MTSSFTFLKVRGIAIGAHWSWLFVFALVVYSLTVSIFPGAYPGLSDGTYIAMGALSALLFFVSILLHELGHAFAALDEDMHIDGITLWLFGGVARFTGMFPSAKAEFKIAIAGPVVSLVIALVLGGAAWLSDIAGGPDPVTGVLLYLAEINGIVLVFNLVPALPLDGGRVLRAFLWHRQRSFYAATMSAARAGRAFGGALVLVGILNLLSGGSTGGLWLSFLGWFLVQAAQSETQIAVVRQALGRHRLGELMTPNPDSVPADMDLTTFIEENLGPRSHSAYPVVADGGRAVGLVSLKQAGTVPAAERSTKTVSDVMLPLDGVPVAGADELVIDKLDDLQEPPRRLLVLDHDRLAGIVALSDALRLLRREEESGVDRAAGARRSGVLVWIVVGAIIVAAAGYLYHPPYAVISPGKTVDVADDLAISGVDTSSIDGSYKLVTINVSQPNGLGLVWSLLDEDDQVLPIDQVIPPSVDPDRYTQEQQEIFDQSRTVAAAAAAQAVGMDVAVTGDGAIVVDVVEGAPAGANLQPEDVIVEIAGEPIGIAQDVSEVLNSRPVGTEFNFIVERNGERVPITMSTESLPQAQGAAIGAFLATRSFNIDLPFEIDFQESDIGGPSAGFVYSLAIADLLDDEDYAAGRTIAATGTIDSEGRVGEIGGIDAKAAAVADDEADLFLVPQSQIGAIDQDGLDIRGVSNLVRALEVLSRTKT